MVKGTQSLEVYAYNEDTDYKHISGWYVFCNVFCRSRQGKGSPLLWDFAQSSYLSWDLGYYYTPHDAWSKMHMIFISVLSPPNDSFFFGTEKQKNVICMCFLAIYSIWFCSLKMAHSFSKCNKEDHVRSFTYIYIYIYIYAQVDVVCYSEYLSNRDEQDFDELFKFLEVISWSFPCFHYCLSSFNNTVIYRWSHTSATVISMGFPAAYLTEVKIFPTSQRSSKSFFKRRLKQAQEWYIGGCINIKPTLLSPQ